MAGAGSLETNNFKIPSVFGSGATYKTAPDMIPTTTPAGSIKASWKDGFPTQTFEPNNAPSGADFNGLFGLLSGLLMNTQMGQMINTYDATYQGNIGGYPNGAIIWFVPIMIGQIGCCFNPLLIIIQTFPITLQQVQLGLGGSNCCLLFLHLPIIRSQQ